MISPLQRKLTAIVLCLTVLFLTPRHAESQIGPTKGQVTGIIIGIVAVGAAIGVGIFLILHRSPSVTGCTASQGDSLTLLSEADRQTYALSGDISGIRSGERVHVSGKKSKDSSGNHIFVVTKVGKDYGPCSAAQSLPAHAASAGSDIPIAGPSSRIADPAKAFP
ncbi:MAG TPA: hypothetical protein VMD97_08040 [Candidatus Aquilonibacter sp.]|nr:hypothetical protein [Candidatus Aquilonibacter sp.]